MDSEFYLRFKNFVIANFFRLVAIGALVLFIGVFVYAVQVDKNSKPPADMRFPMAAASGKVTAGQASQNGRLTIQHLGSQEVSELLTNIVAESLSFNKDNFAGTSAAMEKYFTPAGYKQYREFLSTSAFESTLSSQNLQSGAYVEQDPLEITRGVYGGVFKWVFEVPVTVSFITRGVDSYRDQAAPQNRRFLLRAQFTRVDDAKDPDAVKMEIWQILPPRRMK